MGKSGGTFESGIEAELRAAGEARDDALDIASLALAFAQADRPDVSRAPYEAHLAELADAARTSLARAAPELAANPEIIATTLAGLISGRYAYRGDSETYDDLRNADLMHVIDRRKGLPVALGILYLHIGRALGLDSRGSELSGPLCPAPANRRRRDDHRSVQSRPDAVDRRSSAPAAQHRGA